MGLRFFFRRKDGRRTISESSRLNHFHFRDISLQTGAYKPHQTLYGYISEYYDETGGDRSNFGFVEPDSNCSEPFSVRRSVGKTKLRIGAYTKFYEDILKPELQPALWLTGIGTTDPPHCPARHAKNEYASLLSRGLWNVPDGEGDWEEIKTFVTENFEQIFPHLEQCIERWTFDEWNDRKHKGKYTYSGRKRKANKRARFDYDNEGLFRKDYTGDLFCKIEACFMRDPKDPRNIVARRGKYNVAIGPGVYSCAKTLSNCWHKDTPYLYTSGRSAEDIADWAENQMAAMSSQPGFQRCKNGCGSDLAAAKTGCGCFWYIDDDQSRMDANFHEDVLRFEIWLLSMLGLNHEECMILENNIKYRGVGRHGVWIKRDATRKTGDQQTSVANSLVNLILNLYSFFTQATQHGLSKEEFWTNICTQVQGDDRHTMIPTYLNYFDTQLHEEIHSRFGFPLKFVLETSDLADVDYCSRIYWPTTDPDYPLLLGPKPGKVITKNGWSTSRKLDHASHVRGVALGLQVSSNHVPILREYVAKLLELTDDNGEDAVQNRYSIKSSKMFNPDQDEQYYRRVLGEYYEEAMLSVEEINRVKSVPWLISAPVLAEMSLHGL